MLSAVALFVVVSAISFASLPGGLHVHWVVLPILVLVLAPLTALANAAEFRVMGAINNHRIGWLPATRLAILASAANLLPMPGGVMIRAQALRQRGSTYRHAFAVNAAAMGAWIGVASIVISVLMAATSSRWLAVVILLLFGLGCLLCVGVLLRQVNRSAHLKYLAQFIVVEGLTVAIGGARIFLAFKLIGLSASAVQAVALTAAQIIASAIGIFPGGLGLRELLAGVIATAVHLPAAEAVSAAAVDRVTVQLSIALFALALLPTWRRRRAQPASISEPEQSEQPLRLR